MKYIRFEHTGFVIFQRDINHNDMAKNFPNDTPISAGFVNKNLQVYGESESLKLKSDPSDSIYLEVFFNPI